MFANAFPEIVLEVTTSNDPIELVASGFDAGIHIGELIQPDMVAVRVSNDLRLAVVARRNTSSITTFHEHPTN